MVDTTLRRIDYQGPATSKYVDTLLRYGAVCRGDDILHNTRHIDPTLREEEEKEVIKRKRKRERERERERERRDRQTDRQTEIWAGKVTSSFSLNMRRK